MKTCSVDGCDRGVKARGWCLAHYYRWLRARDLRVDDPIKDHSTYRTGFVRLDAGPLVRAVSRSGVPVARRLDDASRRAYYRARQVGWVNDHLAEAILAEFGLTLDEVYRPDWDEVAA